MIRKVDARSQGSRWQELTQSKSWLRYQGGCFQITCWQQEGFSSGHGVAPVELHLRVKEMQLWRGTEEKQKSYKP